jgi:hypothetical protein
MVYNFYEALISMICIELGIVTLLSYFADLKLEVSYSEG